MWAFGDTTVWDRLEGGFKLHGFGGVPMPSVSASLPLQRLFSLRTHPPAAGCTLAQPSALLPAEFNYCPECGAALIQPVEAASAAWIPPYGLGDGSRLLKHKLGQQSDLQAQMGEQVALPFQSANLRFLVAKMGGKQRQLLAIDPNAGRIAVYNPQAQGQWLEIGSDLLASDLPDWAWTVALDHTESHLAVADRTGLHWLKADWTTGRMQTLHHAIGRALAGPGILSEASGKGAAPNDVICVPIRKGSAGTATLSVLYWWRSTAVAGNSGNPAQGWAEAALPSNMPADEVFGQALRTARWELCWPGRQGFLRVGLDQNKAPQTSWHAWKKDAEDASVTGLPELGAPWQDEKRRFWQQCKHTRKTVKGTDVSIQMHRIDAAADQECFPLPDGEVLSTGKATFSRLHNHWQRPDEFRDNDREFDDIRCPLLQFSQPDGKPGMVLTAHVKIFQDSNSAGAFSSIIHAASLGSNRLSKASLKIEISDANSAPRWLSLQAQGQNQWESNTSALTGTEVLIYDAQLWVYIPGLTGILRWPVAVAD